MKLISEHVDDVELICEATEDGKKNYKIRGVFMQAEIKNRNGPISVIAPNKRIVSTWVNIPNDEKKFALNKLKPYKTIIYPVHKNIVNNLILGQDNTLGIRIPDHPFCKSLSEECKVPITTTSVNRTGQKPQSNVDNILKHFGNDVDLIIDDGDLTGPASSIFLYEKSGLKNLR